MKCIPFLKRKKNFFRAHIVVAWGSKGAAAGTAKHGDCVQMMTSYPPDDVIDTLGAGDTFNGGFIHAFSQCNDVHASVDYACKVAGYKVGSYGYSCLKDFPNNISGHGLLAS